MRKVLFLLTVLPMMLLLACSDDDEETVKLTTEQVVGKWNVTWAQQDGESLDVPSGYVYMNLKSDGTYRTVMFDDYYIGEWRIEGSTVVGTTTDPITERYTFTSLNGKNAEIDYSNSVGDKMKFRATKTDSSDDKLVNSYFRYPSMDWGISVNSVKAYMRGYSLSKETSTSLLYEGKIKENQTAYTFKDGKLNASAIEIGTIEISADALISLLKENFNYIQKQGTYYYFQSKDKKTNAVLTAVNKGMLTYYVIAFNENK